MPLCSFQLIPQISSLSWFTTIVPLVLVLTITAVKDATDDYVSCLPSAFPARIPFPRSPPAIPSSLSPVATSVILERESWSSLWST